VNELWWLLVGHVVMDFWAQSDALAQMKNRNRPNTRVPPGQKPQTMWPYALTAHALMHGAAVAYILASVPLGIAEAVAHWLIDFGKCENWYGIHADQAMHVVCKLIWLWLFLP
jgi:hypothetical protein